MGNPVAVWPPKVITTKILGYIKDSSKIKYSRDIGRSVNFDRVTYYIFGDTFCKDGLVSNTAAEIRDRASPLISTYTSSNLELVDGLLKLTEAEERQWKDEKVRVTLWSFSGIVEIESGVGLMWYEKGLNDKKMELELPIPCGVGIARVNVNPESGELTAHRSEGLLFDAEEPRVGGTSSIIEGEHIYLFSYHDGGLMLARVLVHEAFDSTAYRYWNGTRYSKDWKKAILVMQNMQQGAVIKLGLFGPERPWVFVGCSRFGDSKVMLGTAEQLEGPWEVREVWEAHGIDHDESFKYCVYPHPWAFKVDEGELMVTFSEHCPGGVVAALLKFKMAGIWTIWPLSGLYDVLQAAAGGSYRLANDRPSFRAIIFSVVLISLLIAVIPRATPAFYL